MKKVKNFRLKSCNSPLLWTLRKFKLYNVNVWTKENRALFTELLTITLIIHFYFENLRLNILISFIMKNLYCKNDCKKLCEYPPSSFKVKLRRKPIVRTRLPSPQAEHHTLHIFIWRHMTELSTKNLLNYFFNFWKLAFSKNVGRKDGTWGLYYKRFTIVNYASVACTKIVLRL